MTVPLHLVRVITRQGGYKLPELEHLDVPKKGAYQPMWQGTFLPAGNTRRLPSASNFEGMQQMEGGENPRGWLPEGDLRFWCASKFTNMAQCRCCKVCYFGDREAQKMHLKSGDCSSRLTHAYRHLLRDKACVICDKHTSLRRWGVPLCCEACRVRWRTELGTTVTYELQRLEKLAKQNNKIIIVLKGEVNELQKELLGDAKPLD